jgi:hypothetical protein
MLLAYTHDDQEEAVCIRISQPLNLIYACNSSKFIFKISAVVGIQWPVAFDGVPGAAGRTGDAGRFIGMVGDEMSVAGLLEELEGGVDGGGVMGGAFAGAGRPSSGSEAAR